MDENDIRRSLTSKENVKYYIYRFLDYEKSQKNPFYGLYLKEKKDWRERFLKEFSSKHHRLDLSFNEIGPNEIQFVLDKLGEITESNLKEFILCGNQLGNEGCKKIFRFFSTNANGKKIQLLDLANNQIDNQCEKEILEFIRSNPQFCELSLYRNNDLETLKIKELIRQNWIHCEKDKKIKNEEERIHRSNLISLFEKIDSLPWENYSDLVDDLPKFCESIYIDFNPFFWYVLNHDIEDPFVWEFKFRTKLFFLDQHQFLFPNYRLKKNHPFLNILNPFDNVNVIERVKKFPFPYRFIIESNVCKLLIEISEKNKHLTIEECEEFEKQLNDPFPQKIFKVEKSNIFYESV